MTAGIDDFVVVRRGPYPGDPTEITINCPDKVGLGCDICRIIFEFGLSVVKGDLSTDGKWCYLVFRLMPRVRAVKTIRWSLLKQRLVSACPPLHPTLLPLLDPPPLTRQIYLLQVSSPDRSGFLNDLTQALWEVELTIQKVNVSTAPDLNAVDLFFVTDNRQELPSKQRSEDICDYLRTVLGGPTGIEIDCRLAGPVATLEEGVNSRSAAPHVSLSSSMPSEVQTYLFPAAPSTSNSVAAAGQGMRQEDPLGPAERIVSPAAVTVDNSMSPIHSVLQVKCKDRKGLAYDCLRTLKDTGYQVSYGRIESMEDGQCQIDLYIRDMNGKKVMEDSVRAALCACMKRELERPIRVVVVTHGLDSVLLIACPVEECGRGRPRVLFDVTYALRQIGNIHVFKADINRHESQRRYWEVYRFILQDNAGQPIYKDKVRRHVEAQVRDILMG